jgi:hypothetical protein
MDMSSRRSLLEAAGLEVIEPAWLGSSPTPMAAWKLLVGGDVVPAAVVRIAEGNEHLPEVESKWEELASEAGLFRDNEGFLISVAGIGAAGAPWALVRGNPPLALAFRLASDYGNPEFVAMDMAGRNVCGVTSEEYEIWVVTGSPEVMPNSDSG